MPWKFRGKGESRDAVHAEAETLVIASTSSQAQELATLYAFV
jgi:hypothetical protein